jgi:hypothetical protein
MWQPTVDPDDDVLPDVLPDDDVPPDDDDELLPLGHLPPLFTSALHEAPSTQVRSASVALPQYPWHCDVASAAGAPHAVAFASHRDSQFVAFADELPLLVPPDVDDPPEGFDESLDEHAMTETRAMAARTRLRMSARYAF